MNSEHKNNNSSAIFTAITKALHLTSKLLTHIKNHIFITLLGLLVSVISLVMTHIYSQESGKNEEKIINTLEESKKNEVAALKAMEKTVKHNETMLEIDLMNHISNENIPDSQFTKHFQNYIDSYSINEFEIKGRNVGFISMNNLESPHSRLDNLTLTSSTLHACSNQPTLYNYNLKNSGLLFYTQDLKVSSYSSTVTLANSTLGIQKLGNYKSTDTMLYRIHMDIESNLSFSGIERKVYHIDDYDQYYSEREDLLGYYNAKNPIEFNHINKSFIIDETNKDIKLVDSGYTQYYNRNYVYYKNIDIHSTNMSIFPNIAMSRLNIHNSKLVISPYYQQFGKVDLKDFYDIGISKITDGKKKKVYTNEFSFLDTRIKLVRSSIRIINPVKFHKSSIAFDRKSSLSIDERNIICMSASGYCLINIDGLVENTIDVHEISQQEFEGRYDERNNTSFFTSSIAPQIPPTRCLKIPN